MADEKAKQNPAGVSWQEMKERQKHKSVTDAINEAIQKYGVLKQQLETKIKEKGPLCGSPPDLAEVIFENLQAKGFLAERFSKP